MLFIQQERHDTLQSMPILLNGTRCPEVYILKSLFTHNFFEDFLSIVKSIFDINSVDYIHLSDVGFLQDWQAILDFFIIPELESRSSGFVNFEGTFVIKKIMNNDSYVHDEISHNNAHNILLPLSPGGDIEFIR